LFLLLQGACAYLLVQNNSYQKEKVVSTSNAFVGRIYAAYSNITDYLKLGITNKALSEENARLRKADSSSFYDKSFRILKMNDTLHKQQYEFITARVINNSVSRINNYITLDKGSLQGIEPDMGVISSNGVVGYVKDVSAHFSTVVSLLHSGFKVSSVVKKNNYFCSTVWNGASPRFANVLDIPIHAQVSIGDTIVTNTFSKLFPSGILIGTVNQIGIKGESFKEIKIRLSTDFQNLSYVYVTRNIMKAEIDTLESKREIVQ
jgi:rod shape-determining protein MreC